MPEMDGMGLCERIKTNIVTSHIPVILLTAKTEVESKLRGLEIGADDYITKPFNVDLLKARVQNIIISRFKLRERFNKEIFLKPGDITVTSTDESFLQKLMDLVNSAISNSEFKVDELSAQMGMSRRTFFDKLKSVTGHSPADFIRIMRLKKAAVLLIQQHTSVSEVCYEVGFSNPEYFSRKFREHFGSSPSKYNASKSLI